MAAAETYPDDLKYHPEHDWARVDGFRRVTQQPKNAPCEIPHVHPIESMDRCRFWPRPASTDV